MDLNQERKLWRKEYKRVACLDEAGRGSLAGPVVAAAVTISSKLKTQRLKLQLKTQNLKDSKKLTIKKREEFYKILTKHPSIKWGIGRVLEKKIDKINILEATKLAMKKAVKKLKIKPDFLIIDGNFKINLPVSKKSITRARRNQAERRDETQVSSIIKADEKVFSCAVASIIAKVFRDKLMKRYHTSYLQYGFDRHKGYSTKYHCKMLKKYGFCQVHRKTFKPLKDMIK